MAAAAMVVPPLSVEGCIVGGMPKMQVYLPEDLYRQVKEEGDRINVSAILQAALAEHLADLARLRAMDDAIAAYEAEYGVVTDEEIEAQAAADAAATVIVPVKRQRRSKPQSAA